MSKKKKTEQDNRIVTGASWMTFGSLSSRMLGALYIIPWMAWMGSANEANAAHALYQVAYVPYAFFLAFATAGVPSAIPKQISHFNAIQEYETSKKIYKQGLILMILTGIVSAALLYILAPVIVESSPIADQNEAIFVIRSLVPALVLIPSKAVTRGLFQGHNRMKEPAISQIIEQFARVLFILGTVYIIRQIINGEVVVAVAFSTFAAFIGAVFSILYLLFKLKRTSTALNRTPEESKNNINLSTRNIFRDIIVTAIPFVIISTGLNMFQIIDQQTFAPLMEYFFPNVSGNEIQVSYGIISANAHKLSTIITSFGSALAITSVPLLSDLIAQRKYKEVSIEFEKAVQLLMFIMVPAIVGMFVVAEPFYAFFYGSSAFGVYATRIYAIVSLFMGLYMVLGNILQAINQRRYGLYSLIAGLIVKLVTQPLFIRTIGETGMLFSTIAGLAVTSFLLFKVMYDTVGFSISFLSRRVLLIFILGLGMGIVTFIASGIFDMFLSYDSRTQSLIGLLLTVLVGVAAYGYLTLKTRLAEKILGPQAKKARIKLGIK